MSDEMFTFVFTDLISIVVLVFLFFFFNDTATTEIYTLSLHYALPISRRGDAPWHARRDAKAPAQRRDRKSTRLNSSHVRISYAVFCLKKKKLDKPQVEARKNLTQTHGADLGGVEL